MYLIFFHGVSTVLAMDIWSSISKRRRETHHEGHERREETTEYKKRLRALRVLRGKNLLKCRHFIGALRIAVAGDNACSDQVPNCYDSPYAQKTLYPDLWLPDE
jgi:hypothetical protein